MPLRQGINFQHFNKNEALNSSLTGQILFVCGMNALTLFSVSYIFLQYLYLSDFFPTLQ